MFATMFKLKFVCLCVCVCCRVFRANYFLRETLRMENFALGRMGVFNISKVSSRDIQRHKRVMGDADSSVNSAGG